MTRYLLDTNILSDPIRNPEGIVAAKIDRLPANEREALCTSIVAAAELRFGAARKNSERLSRKVEEMLRSVEILPLEPDADRHYARLRVEMEKSGNVIGANDMLIAAHAVSIGCVLVTDNVREFGRVPGLRIENWLKA